MSKTSKTKQTQSQGSLQGKPSQRGNTSGDPLRDDFNDPLKRDFRNFLYVVWKHLNLPDPTPRQYEIAYYLQHGPKKRMVQAFRGVGKSWITAAFVLWLLYRDPQLRIMVVSASAERAKNFTKFVKSLIHEMDILKHLIPRNDQRQSSVSFDVGPALADQNPSVVAKGITGQLTGSRADIIVADDIEVPNNSATQTMREHLGESIKEFAAIIKPGGEIIYLGTPQSFQTVYSELPKRDYDIQMWPALYPDQEYLNTFGTYVYHTIKDEVQKNPDIAGEPTDPQRFDSIDLQERLAEYGRSGFNLQFMLDTHLSDLDKFPLRLSDLVVMNLNPDIAPQKIIWSNDPSLAYNDLEAVGLRNDRYYRPLRVGGKDPITEEDLDWIEYQDAVLFIDPSGRGKDETAWVVLKQLHSYIFLLEAGGWPETGFSSEALQHLAETARKYGVHTTVYEANYGGGMFGELLKPVMDSVHPCRIEEVKNYGKSKENRIIDVLEPVMNRHRLVVDKKVIENDLMSTKDRLSETSCQYQLFYQMTNISREKGCLNHDDRLDALAGGVAWFIEQMSQDEEHMIQAYKDEKWDEELRNFHSYVFEGNNALAKGPSWISHR